MVVTCVQKLRNFNREQDPRKDGDRMSENMLFDYSKLRGRIVEKFGTLSAFANSFGCSDGTLSSKMTSKTYFTNEEIVSACRLLNISVKDVDHYFFTLKV